MLFFNSSNGLSLHTQRNHWSPHTRNYYRYGNVMIMEKISIILWKMWTLEKSYYIIISQNLRCKVTEMGDVIAKCVRACVCVCMCGNLLKSEWVCVTQCASRSVRRLQLGRFIKLPSVNCWKYLSLTNTLLGQKVLNSAFCCYNYQHRIRNVNFLNVCVFVCVCECVFVVRQACSLCGGTDTGAQSFQ